MNSIRTARSSSSGRRTHTRRHITKRQINKDDNDNRIQSDSTNNEGRESANSNSSKADFTKDNNNGGNSNSSGQNSASISDPDRQKPSSCAFCVPDNNPRILYQGSWTLDSQGNSFNTTHSTQTPGSTISFNFNGSGIIVFGTVPQSNATFAPPTVSYTLDASPPFITTQANAGQAVQNQPLFAVKDLSEDEHRIFINVTNTVAPFIFDYFFVFPNSKFFNMSVVNGSLPSPSFVPLPSSSFSPIPTSETTAAQNDSPADGQVNLLKTLQVLATILGLLVLFLIAGVVFLVFRLRTARRSHKARSLVSSKGTRQDVTMFTSTESILRNSPSFMFTEFSRSERPGSSVFLPPPRPKSEKSFFSAP